MGREGEFDSKLACPHDSGRSPEKVLVLKGNLSNSKLWGRDGRWNGGQRPDTFALPLASIWCRVGGGQAGSLGVGCAIWLSAIGAMQCICAQGRRLGWKMDK